MYFLPLDLTRRPGLTFAAALVASTMLLAICGATMALAAQPDDVRSVVVHVPKHGPHSKAESMVLLGKLRSAALEACGGSDFSFPEYKRTIAHSPCYEDALARAVRDADSEMLAEAFAQSNHRNPKG